MDEPRASRPRVTGVGRRGRQIRGRAGKECPSRSLYVSHAPSGAGATVENQTAVPLCRKTEADAV